jgi:hypothetical protein
MVILWGCEKPVKYIEVAVYNIVGDKISTYKYPVKIETDEYYWSGIKTFLGDDIKIFKDPSKYSFDEQERVSLWQDGDRVKEGKLISEIPKTTTNQGTQAELNAWANDQRKVQRALDRWRR